LRLTRKPIYTALVFFTLLLSTAFAAGNRERLIERGDLFFKIRGEHHLKEKAVTANISNALSAYLEAYKAGEPTAELIVKIMHASYFYATYAETDKTLQKEAVTRAMEIGEKGLETYPESAGINYWMAGLWGRWSKLHGIIASSRKDVAKKIKSFAERTIELDPLYCEGGGYRTLGRLNFKTPKIPFFISWPSKKKALALLKKAVEAGPKNLTNHLFYAEALIERGKRDEAKKEVGFIINTKVDDEDEKVVEKRQVQREAVDLNITLNDNVYPLNRNNPLMQ